MPAEARRDLQLDGEVQFVVEVGDGTIVLRPAVTIAKDDAWAHTAEHRQLVARALRDVKEGRVLRGATERRVAKASR